MSNLKVNTINDASGGSNAVLYGVAAPANSMGFRNRIINGDMRIDQRNAGASVTANNGLYTLDRFTSLATQTAKGTIQQASVAPATFQNSFLYTSSSAYSVLSSDYFAFGQYVEGYNIADLAWGTASAQTVTLSFWVRSSLTGTFGGSLRNNAGDRSYAFTYTVSTANTWEQKTVTIAGDTSGTWLTTNGVGIRVLFSMGAGSTWGTAAGSWAAGNYLSATGATSVVGTSGATFYITGVQLEAGSVASPFERRDYGRELIMCERYYQALTDNMRISAMAFNSTVCPATWVFKTTMRAAPTTTATVGTSTILVGGSNLPVTSIGGGVSSVYGYSMDVTVASGATAGFGAELRIVGGRVAASAEL
jgi:hypothetical protein